MAKYEFNERTELRDVCEAANFSYDENVEEEGRKNCEDPISEYTLGDFHYSEDDEETSTPENHFEYGVYDPLAPKPIASMAMDALENEGKSKGDFCFSDNDPGTEPLVGGLDIVKEIKKRTVADALRNVDFSENGELAKSLYNAQLTLQRISSEALEKANIEQQEREIIQDLDAAVHTLRMEKRDFLFTLVKEMANFIPDNYLDMNPEKRDLFERARKLLKEVEHGLCVADNFNKEGFGLSTKVECAVSLWPEYLIHQRFRQIVELFKSVCKVNVK